MQSFHKYTAAGNDFVIFGDLSHTLDQEIIRQLCDRHFGIGADGIIIYRKSSLADGEMIYFNSDGKRGRMCGNGLRCFTRFLFDQGLKKEQYQILVGQDLWQTRLEKEIITTFFPTPQPLFWEQNLCGHTFYGVDSGVNHLVCFSDESYDVVGLAKEVLGQKELDLTGYNVNIASVMNKHTLTLATYENGVGGQTLACGTGAVGTAWVAHILGLVGPIIDVIPSKNQVLCVDLTDKVSLRGPANHVFTGQVDIASCVAL